jgi:SOS-response transcriptional repressor LexA
MLAFRVPDNSMSKRNICEGDIALIEEKSFVRDGDLAVAIVKKASAVLRMFYRDGQYFELRSSDENGTTRFAADKVQICGIYRGLLRPAK